MFPILSKFYAESRLKNQIIRFQITWSHLLSHSSQGYFYHRQLAILKHQEVQAVFPLNESAPHLVNWRGRVNAAGFGA